jgi:Rha family phage regulatory protein
MITILLSLTLQKGNTMLDLRIINNKVSVSSKQIAEIFKKNHADVLVKIERLPCSQGFRDRNFTVSSYTSPQNKVLPSYEISRDGFSFLAMGFTGKKAASWKEKYIDAFNEMELAINNRVSGAPKSMEELNAVSKEIEKLKEVGSFHGKGLAGYKKLKSKADEGFRKALNSAQLVLKIK